MAKKREDIGVYFFEGFLEGGTTTYIQSLISDPQLPEDLRILILQTEEGMEELEPVPGREIFVEQLDGWDDVTPERLAALEDKTECNTIMVELNGMWQELDFFKRMPENWYPFRKFVIADASTFVSYNNNMRALAADKLKESTVRTPVWTGTPCARSSGPPPGRCPSTSRPPAARRSSTTPPSSCPTT